MEVSYVNTLKDAAIAIEKIQPEIIFLDNHLPDGLGIDYVKTIKLVNPIAKVVMITAFDNFSDRAKAFTNEVDIFISKPFTKELIYQTVDKLKWA